MHRELGWRRGDLRIYEIYTPYNLWGAKSRRTEKNEREVSAMKSKVEEMDSKLDQILSHLDPAHSR